MNAGNLLIAAPTLLETYIVNDRRQNELASARLNRFASIIEVIPFDRELAEIARTAYQRFGKGSGHPARLNYGDTFSYALARKTGLPLLCTSHDFVQTDSLIA